MSTSERVIGYVGRTLAAVTILIFLYDIVTGGSLSAVSRVVVMAIAASAYLGVFIRQCQIAYQYEGAPVTLPLAFRWVVAQWFGVTGVLLTWFLIVSVWPAVFNATISAVAWSFFAISTLFFFGRWLSIGKPQIAGPGETGANK